MKVVRLSDRECVQVRQAILAGIQNELYFIDCHLDVHTRKAMKGHEATIARSERQIANWRKVVEKFNTAATAPAGAGAGRK